MSETKWTPGPWVVDRNPDGRIGTHIRASVPTVKGAVKGVSVARITVGGGVADDDKGNAHLIASAPDLYEALDRLVGCVNGLGKHPVRDLDEAMEEARHALARARGDTP